jgi:hypothetical protein
MGRRQKSPWLLKSKRRHDVKTNRRLSEDIRRLPARYASRSDTYLCEPDRNVANGESEEKNSYKKEFRIKAPPTWL